MTATQVFMRFLKESLGMKQYAFVMYVIMHDSGNKYFSNRPLYRRNFVEGYLSRHNKTLYGFATRFLMLAKNVMPMGHYTYLNNPFKKHMKKVANRNYASSVNGAFVNLFRNDWHEFLEKYVDTEKSFHSNFRKDEINGVEYKFKNLDKLDEWKMISSLIRIK